MSILRHSEATSDERAAYLKRASAIRRGTGAEADEAEAQTAEDAQDVENENGQENGDAGKSNRRNSEMSNCRRPSSSC